MTDDRTEKGIHIESIEEHGLLWLINTTVFHPRGFALGYSPSKKTFTLLGDGTERYTFTEDGGAETADTDAKFQQVEELFSAARAAHAKEGD